MKSRLLPNGHMQDGKYKLLVFWSTDLKKMVAQWINPLNGKVFYWDVSRFNLRTGRIYQFRMKKSKITKLLKEVSQVPSTRPRLKGKELRKLFDELDELLK